MYAKTEVAFSDIGEESESGRAKPRARVARGLLILLAILPKRTSKRELLLLALLGFRLIQLIQPRRFPLMSLRTNASTSIRPFAIMRRPFDPLEARLHFLKVSRFAFPNIGVSDKNDEPLLHGRPVPSSFYLPPRTLGPSNETLEILQPLNHSLDAFIQGMDLLASVVLVELGAATCRCMIRRWMPIRLGLVKKQKSRPQGRYSQRDER